MHNSKNTGAHTFMRSQTNLKKLSWGKLEEFIIRASISSHEQTHITGRHTEENFAISISKCSSLNPEEAQHEAARQTWDEKASCWLKAPTSISDRVDSCFSFWEFDCNSHVNVSTERILSLFSESSLNFCSEWVSVDVIISSVNGAADHSWSEKFEQSKMKRKPTFVCLNA